MPPQEYLVGTGEGSQFRTIAEALEVVGAGDTIVLQSGLYEELVKITEDVTLSAAARSPEDADDAETVIAGTVIISGNATLTGVQIRGQVDVRKGHVLIDACDIHHGNDGVRVGAQCKLTLKSSRVHHCTAGGNGIYFMSGAAGEVADTDIYECRMNGVHVDGSSVVLHDSRIRDCLFGVFYSGKADGLIANNTIEHIGKFGVYVVEESDPVVRANTVRECGVQCAFVSKSGKGLWTDNTFEGSLHVLAGCAAKLSENRVSERSDVESGDAESTPVPVA